MNNQDLLERDIYAIEEDENGNKRVHVYAYGYFADDGTDTPYRLVEFTFMYIPIDSEVPFAERYDAELNVSKQYIGDYSVGDLQKALEDYFEEPLTELDYKEISPETPCGFYIER